MTPNLFLASAIIPALALLPPEFDTPGARVQLLATPLQESGLTRRIQVPSGAARSFLQMERGGAVTAVVWDAHCQALLRPICDALSIPLNASMIFEAIAWHDVLACIVGRLAYWLSPLDVPAVGDKAGALRMYAQTWRPAWALQGQPEPGRWDASYAAALSAITTPASISPTPTET